MGEKMSTRFDVASVVSQKRINRRMFRSLTSVCRYCSGYEDKIVEKGEDPVHKEVADMERHELINRIAAHLGDSPELLARAEEIFDELKYCVTEYVLKYEFNEESALSVQVAVWLERRRQPELIKPLEHVINKYLRP